MPQMAGQIQQTDFFNNVGGTNLVDSVMRIQDGQAAGGYNFDYLLTGGVRKRPGSLLINSTPDTQLYSLGFGLYAPTSGTSKTLFRAAGTKLQNVNTSANIFTNCIEDNTAGTTDAFLSGTTQDVQFVQFSNGGSDILWAAGGGAGALVGAYNTTNYTLNGVAAPTGTMTATNSTSGIGQWSTGNYGKFFYTMVLMKGSTGALSNAGYLSTIDAQPGDPSATTTSTLTDSVNLAWTLTGLDTTTISQIWIYRSALAGVSGFTTGNLIAQLPSTATSFVDLGDIGNPDILLSALVPRTADTILDNTPLPAGNYNTLANWGHRLCTSSGNNLYISDVNKSESWPLTNYITVPSAGPITGLATISFTSPQANALLELLVIFKEREVWALNPGTNNDYTTWTLLRIDNTVGCPNQSLVVSAQGYLAWIDFRGVWIWDGSSKPTYCSRLIEPLFGNNGDLDKSKFNEACSAFFRRENQIVWYLSSKTYGTQKYAIKMDVRLTLEQVQQGLTGRTMEAVLIQDLHTNPVYACLAYVPYDSQNEQLVLGDNAGKLYFASNAYNDGGSNYPFSYLTKPINCGDPNTIKQFHRVIVWVQDFGNFNLELDYWSGYQTSPQTMSHKILPISTEQGTTAGLWDTAIWDYSYWDSFTTKVTPLVFNLDSGVANSNIGTAIQLQFQNNLANQPITIHGFSLQWSPMGGLT